MENFQFLLSEDFPLHKSIKTKKIDVLSYGLPKKKDFNQVKLNSIDSVVNYAISNKMMPGAQIMVAKNGKVIFNKAYGYKTYEKKDPILWNNLYDVASLTKILSSVPLLMHEYEKKNINKETTLSYLFPNKKLKNKSNLNFGEMLSHQSGLFPWIPFYKETIDSVTKFPLATFYNKKKNNKFSVTVNRNLYLNEFFLDTIQKRIIDSEVSEEKKYLYSDLSYYFFKDYLESKYDKNLDELLKSQLLTKIGANNTTYLPLKYFHKSKIVPSEIDNYFRQDTLIGYVHDMGAAMQGGIGGHAGLFSNANDITKIMQMFIQGGNYGSKIFFSKSTIDYFNNCYYCQKGNRRGLGFDKPQIDESLSTCGCVPMSSFGHSGFTGTYAWGDPENQIVYVFLSNRTYPTMNNNKLSDNNIRTEIQRIIYDSLK